MLPEAFRERMQRMLGKEYEAFSEAFGGERCQALRLNALKKGMDGRSAAERFGGVQRSNGEDFAHLTKVPWAENGYYYQPEDQPGKHPFHEAGLYYIQEPSAMAPAELLDVRPGERVLDLCAAPGGKSTQIAAKLQGRGILVCNEIHPARAKILSENIERMGICNACVTNETPERLADFFPGYFDKILVDAPCSGEGMFRKNEAACEEWSLENVKLCAKRQDKILDQAARMLRPGGKLVYSTCTFTPEEDEGSIVRFLRRNRAIFVLPIEKERLGLAGCDGSAEYLAEGVTGDNQGFEGQADSDREGINREPPEGVTADAGFRMLRGSEGEVSYKEGYDMQLERTLRMWPHQTRGEGHFAALLQKEGGVAAEEGRESLVSSVNGFTEQGSTITRAQCNRKTGTESAAEKRFRNPKRSAKGTQREPDQETEALTSFCKENIRFSASLKRAGGNGLFSEIGRAVGMGEDVRPVRFGDNLYLVPTGMPSLDGLKVLRPGLHLGEWKKNRFEPSHALALALPPEFAKHVWNLDSRGSLADMWLKGQTFPAEGEKGWYLICVDGFSIGWGKLAGGAMKNHYPIGLRR